MKFNVRKDALLKGLQKICNIIGNKTTLPVLANVLVESGENSITMTTTDLELRLSTKVEAVIETEGKATIPAKRLLGLVSKFKNDTISFDINEKFNTKIVCGTGEFMLLGLDPKDFPEDIEFTPVRKIKMKQADFGRMIDRISYAVSLDDSRKVLHGILLSIKEGHITAVSTDGKRLALVEKLLEEAPQGSDGDVIMTLKAATEAKRILEKEGDVNIEIGEKQAVFNIGDTVIVSKLIEGAYPQYRQVIPKDFSKIISIPRTDFIDALEIVSIPLFDTSSYVMLKFGDNTLKFEANNINVGEGHESIGIEYAGDKVEVSFNPQFLSDPFKRLDVENVTLKMNDALTPICIESGDGFLYVIMPMRKNK